jgi:alkylhydroperoxidase family enzyme
LNPAFAHSSRSKAQLALRNLPLYAAFFGDFSDFSMQADKNISAAIQSATDFLNHTGSWWSAQEKAAVLAFVLQQKEIPGSTDANNQLLNTEVKAIVQQLSIAMDKIDHQWFDKASKLLGKESYAELLGITAIANALAILFGAFPETIPALNGDDARPDNASVESTAANDAWLPQASNISEGTVNVARALSIVPETNKAFGLLLEHLYKRGRTLFDAEWPDRALTRAQIENIALIVSESNACQYCYLSHAFIAEHVLPAQQKTQAFSTPQMELLIAFCETGVKTPSLLPSATVAMRQEFSDAQIQETLATIATFACANRVANGSGISVDTMIANR